MKSEKCDVSIVKIFLRTDNKKLNKKGYELNTLLKELRKERNICLIDNTNKIKAQYLSKGKLHLNKRNSNTLGGTFIIELFKTLN